MEIFRSRSRSHDTPPGTPSSRSHDTPLGAPRSRRQYTPPIGAPRNTPLSTKSSSLEDKDIVETSTFNKSSTRSESSESVVSLKKPSLWESFKSKFKMTFMTPEPAYEGQEKPPLFQRIKNRIWPVGTAATSAGAATAGAYGAMFVKHLTLPMLTGMVVAPLAAVHTLADAFLLYRKLKAVGNVNATEILGRILLQNIIPAGLGVAAVVGSVGLSVAASVGSLGAATPAIAVAVLKSAAIYFAVNKVSSWVLKKVADMIWGKNGPEKKLVDPKEKAEQSKSHESFDDHQSSSQGESESLSSYTPTESPTESPTERPLKRLRTEKMSEVDSVPSRGFLPAEGYAALDNTSHAELQDEYMERVERFHDPKFLSQFRERMKIRTGLNDLLTHSKAEDAIIGLEALDKQVDRYSSYLRELRLSRNEAEDQVRLAILERVFHLMYFNITQLGRRLSALKSISLKDQELLHKFKELQTQIFSKLEEFRSKEVSRNENDREISFVSPASSIQPALRSFYPAEGYAAVGVVNGQLDPELQNSYIKHVNELHEKQPTFSEFQTIQEKLRNMLDTESGKRFIVGVEAIEEQVNSYSLYLNALRPSDLEGENARQIKELSQATALMDFNITQLKRRLASQGNRSPKDQELLRKFTKLQTQIFSKLQEFRSKKEAKINDTEEMPLNSRSSSSIEFEEVEPSRSSTPEFRIEPSAIETQTEPVEISGELLAQFNKDVAKRQAEFNKQMLDALEKNTDESLSRLNQILHNFLGDIDSFHQKLLSGEEGFYRELVLNEAMKKTMDLWRQSAREAQVILEGWETSRRKTLEVLERTRLKELQALADAERIRSEAKKKIKDEKDLSAFKRLEKQQQLDIQELQAKAMVERNQLFREHYNRVQQAEILLLRMGAARRALLEEAENARRNLESEELQEGETLGRTGLRMRLAAQYGNVMKQLEENARYLLELEFNRFEAQWREQGFRGLKGGVELEAKETSQGIEVEQVAELDKIRQEFEKGKQQIAEAQKRQLEADKKVSRRYLGKWREFATTRKSAREQQLKEDMEATEADELQTRSDTSRNEEEVRNQMMQLQARLRQAHNEEELRNVDQEAQNRLDPMRQEEKSEFAEISEQFHENLRALQEKAKREKAEALARAAEAAANLKRTQELELKKRADALKQQQAEALRKQQLELEAKKKQEADEALRLQELEAKKAKDLELKKKQQEAADAAKRLEQQKLEAAEAAKKQKLEKVQSQEQAEALAKASLKKEYHFEYPTESDKLTYALCITTGSWLGASQVFKEGAKRRFRELTKPESLQNMRNDGQYAFVAALGRLLLDAKEVTDQQVFSFLQHYLTLPRLSFTGDRTRNFGDLRKGSAPEPTPGSKPGAPPPRDMRPVFLNRVFLSEPVRTLFLGLSETDKVRLLHETAERQVYLGGVNEQAVVSPAEGTRLEPLLLERKVNPRNVEKIPAEPFGVQQNSVPKGWPLAGWRPTSGEPERPVGQYQAYQQDLESAWKLPEAGITLPVMAQLAENGQLNPDFLNRFGNDHGLAVLRDWVYPYLLCTLRTGKKGTEVTKFFNHPATVEDLVHTLPASTQRLLDLTLVTDEQKQDKAQAEMEVVRMLSNIMHVMSKPMDQNGLGKSPFSKEQMEIFRGLNTLSEKARAYHAEAGAGKTECVSRYPEISAHMFNFDSQDLNSRRFMLHVLPFAEPNPEGQLTLDQMIAGRLPEAPPPPVIHMTSQEFLGWLQKNLISTTPPTPRTARGTATAAPPRSPLRPEAIQLLEKLGRGVLDEYDAEENYPEIREILAENGIKFFQMSATRNLDDINFVIARNRQKLEDLQNPLLVNQELLQKFAQATPEDRKKPEYFGMYKKFAFEKWLSSPEGKGTLATQKAAKFVEHLKTKRTQKVEVLKQEALKIEGYQRTQFSRNIEMKTGGQADLLTAAKNTTVVGEKNSVLILCPRVQDSESVVSELKKVLGGESSAIIFRNKLGQTCYQIYKNSRWTASTEEELKAYQGKVYCVYTTDCRGGDFGEFSNKRVAHQFLLSSGPVPGIDSVYQWLRRDRETVDPEHPELSAPVTVFTDTSITWANYLEQARNNQTVLNMRLMRVRALTKAREAIRQDILNAFVAHGISQGNDKFKTIATEVDAVLRDSELLKKDLPEIFRTVLDKIRSKVLTVPENAADQTERMKVVVAVSSGHNNAGRYLEKLGLKVVPKETIKNEIEKASSKLALGEIQDSTKEIFERFKKHTEEKESYSFSSAECKEIERFFREDLSAYEKLALMTENKAAEGFIGLEPYAKTSNAFARRVAESYNALKKRLAVTARSAQVFEQGVLPSSRAEQYLMGYQAGAARPASTTATGYLE